MLDSISLQSQQIRKQIRIARRALTDEQQQQAAQQVLARLKHHPKVIAAKHISLTLPFDGEIDLTPFINWCWLHNKQLYLPVVHPEQQGKLLFVAYDKNTPMHSNRYGINEPQLIHGADKKAHYLNTCEVTQLDIVITPLVAFDKKGHRIGMGGGYYDRLLAPWHHSQSGPYPIGVAHDCQLLAHIPTQEWDVPLPEILTPSCHYQF